MKRIKQGLFVLTLAMASVEAYAQQGRGSYHCDLDQPVVKTIADTLQDSTFAIRQTVSQLPRPELWRPYVRPIGMSIRRIQSLLHQGQRYGACREIAMEAGQLNRSFQTMYRQLSIYGRGNYGKELFFAVKHVQLVFEELNAAIYSPQYGNIGRGYGRGQPGNGHGGGRGGRGGPR